MAGRMGGNKCTVRNLEVIKIDKDKNLIFVKGAVQVQMADILL